MTSRSRVGKRAGGSGSNSSPKKKKERQPGVPPTWELSSLQPSELLFKLKEEAEGKDGQKGTQERYDDAQSGLYQVARAMVTGSRLLMRIAYRVMLFLLALFTSVAIVALVSLGLGRLFGWTERTNVILLHLAQCGFLMVKIIVLLMLANKANQLSLWFCVGGAKSGDNWPNLMYNALYDKPVKEQEKWQKKQDTWIGIGRGGDDINFKMRERRRLRQAERLRKCGMPIPKTNSVYWLFGVIIVGSMVWKVHRQWFEPELAHLAVRTHELDVPGWVGEAWRRWRAGVHVERVHPGTGQLPEYESGPARATAGADRQVYANPTTDLPPTQAQIQQQPQPLLPAISEAKEEEEKEVEPSLGQGPGQKRQFASPLAPV
eukprot:g729.t1